MHAVFSSVLRLAALLCAMLIAVPAWAEAPNLEEIAFAAETGRSEETLLRMAASRDDWEVDGRTAIELLRRGVPPTVVQALSKGAHPTSWELVAGKKRGTPFQLEGSDLDDSSSSPWRRLRTPADRQLARRGMGHQVVGGTMVAIGLAASFGVGEYLYQRSECGMFFCFGRGFYYLSSLVYTTPVTVPGVLLFGKGTAEQWRARSRTSLALEPVWGETKGIALAGTW